jgi:unsaturated rhamnogalacturonyl hydrolase
MKNKKVYRIMKSVVALLLLVFGLSHTSICVAQSKKDKGYFSSWPKGSSPKEVGKKIAYHFVETPHTNFNRPTPPKVITYPETCTWYGALNLSKLTGDKKLL